MSDAHLHQLVERLHQLANDKSYRGWQERREALEKAAQDRGAEAGVKEVMSWFGGKGKERRPAEAQPAEAPA